MREDEGECIKVRVEVRVEVMIRVSSIDFDSITEWQTTFQLPIPARTASDFAATPQM